MTVHLTGVLYCALTACSIKEYQSDVYLQFGYLGSYNVSDFTVYVYIISMEIFQQC